MRLFIIIFLALFNVTFSQSKEGAWDNIRTTNETFVLKTGEKKLIRSTDLPTGTTEAVFRITLLDDNQKISSSLVSVLKSIPDPTGISQGAAGGVFLLSAISGDDKCRYAVFTSAADAENYISSGAKTNACLIQDTPVNKQARLLSSDSKCLESNPKNLYFVFQSDNYIFKEKIVLEIVPWVNSKLSRGWNNTNKKEIISIANGMEWTQSLAKKDFFYASFLETIQSKFTYAEFRQLLQAEKAKAIELATEEALKKSGETEKYYNHIREKSLELIAKGKTDQAIDLINTEMIAKNRATYREYVLLGDYHLLTKQFSKAENYYNQGLKLNPSAIPFQLGLAHVYLFTDRLSQAKEIHKKYYRENLATGKTWAQQVKADFASFKEKGFPAKDFKKIIRIIE